MLRKEEVYYRLKEMLVIKNYYARNKWLALNPKMQALHDYMNEPHINYEVNDMVDSVMRIVVEYICEDEPVTECKELAVYDPGFAGHQS